MVYSTAARVYPQIVENLFSVEQELDFIDRLDPDYYLKETGLKKEWSLRATRLLLTLADERGVVGLKTRIATLQGHEERITAVALNPEGTLFASGDNSGKIILWGLPED